MENSLQHHQVLGSIVHVWGNERYLNTSSWLAHPVSMASNSQETKPLGPHGHTGVTVNEDD